MSRLLLISFKIGIAICIFFPYSVFANPEKSYNLSYHLSYPNIGNQNCLAIKAEIKGNLDGRIQLRIPNNVTDLHFRGKPNLQVIPKEQPNICEIIHQPNEIIFVDYQYCINNTSRNIDFPIIEADFFHFLVGQILITPEAENKKIVQHVKINATSMPDGFSFVTSHTFNQNEYEIVQPIDAFRNAVMIGSKNVIKSFNVKGNPVYLVAKGNWSFFKNDDLMNYLTKMVTIQRDFWNDYDFPHYVIALLQQDVPDNEKYIIGTHKENVLTMSIPDGSQEKLPKVLWGLSHELFHAWLGLKIKIPEPQGDLQWFFEGVNDYYGLRLALDSGLINYNDYISFYNTIVKSYSLSPFKNDKNNEISKYFALRGPHGILPQMKGHILFKEFSNKLKSIRKPNPFDGAMLDIYHEFGKKSNNLITQEKLDKIFIKHVGKNNWSELKNYLILGKPFVNSPTLFEKNTRLLHQNVEVPVFGFDINYFIKSKKIGSLDPKSNAYHAGLRNNQSVLNYFLDFDHSTAMAEILVEENSKQKLIRFLPDKENRLVPQYVKAVQ